MSIKCQLCHQDRFGCIYDHVISNVYNLKKFNSLTSVNWLWHDHCSLFAKDPCHSKVSLSHDMKLKFEKHLKLQIKSCFLICYKLWLLQTNICILEWISLITASTGKGLVSDNYCHFFNNCNSKWLNCTYKDAMTRPTLP